MDSLPSEPPFSLKRHDRRPQEAVLASNLLSPFPWIICVPHTFLFNATLSLGIVFYFGMDDNSNFEWSEHRKFILIAVNQITTSWIDKEYNDDLNMVH